ncbi:FtsW/RodA/SpoVE family cell cycle protein [Paratractidigestivibacter sp.]|uniref:FtsW/RodA/SpoVE family cell cycle protein n=1 Tax=Paratractidigestivibacter sp. TaxID=2847316 RepID=UPI002ABDC06B|nr:FtsW/RodA/SpoVE family cell cycle protein [Paratractidigestivibacter sp.]
MRKKHRQMARDTSGQSSDVAARTFEEGHGFQRRHTELFLLILAAIPVLLLHCMFVVTSGNQLGPENLGVPLGLFAAFAAAHVAIRKLAPAADPAILPIVFMLSGVGITYLTRLKPELAVNQVIWLFLSVATMVAVLAFARNFERLAEYKYTIGIVGVVLLLLPAVIGREISGSKLWIYIGGFGFQPGEFAKILIVLFLAFYLATNREALSISMRRVGPFAVPRLRMLLPLLVMWGISLLLVVFERDLGSALLFFVFFVIMLYVATGRVSYVIVSFLLLAIGGTFCYFAFSHVRNRVNIWIDPWADAAGGGYQIVQSLYSLADGGLVGTGIGKGLPTYVPVVESDFIFTAIAEESGLLGGAAVLIGFLLLGVRGFATAARAKSDSSAFAAVGLTSALCFQAFLIVGGVTKLLPLTGVTLPFMSQGGTSLLASFIIVGLLLRAGDDGTGHATELKMAGGTAGSALLGTTGTTDSRDAGANATGELMGEAGRGISGVVHGANVRGRFNIQSAESGVLGRVALGKRLTALITVFSLLFAVLIANLTYVMQIDSSRVQSLPNNNHTIAKSAYVQRGAIVTSDGVTLAESLQQSDGTYLRAYPLGTLASHTVGYISTQYGTSGIEATMNETLTGHADYSNWRSALYSLAGVQVSGSTVSLTINSQIQKAVEQALEGYTGAIVILNPQTGAVIAKASSPTYSNKDLADVVGGTGSQMLDRATQALYAPGSTFKTVTLAAALDSGLATLETEYEAPSSLEIGGAAVTNYNGNDYGTLSLKDAIALSSNTALAQVGNTLGASKLVSYADAFGFGSELGLDFSCRASLMPVAGEMTEWETAWAACGQPVGEHTSPAGPQVTVMQNAVIAAAIANGGVAMNPYVVDHVLSPEGTQVNTTQPKSLGQVISADASAGVKEAMLACVEEGSGQRAQVSGTRVAGKTGTAEVGDGNANSLFIGFAPYDSPTLAISICVESNGTDVEGEAASIAGRVIAATLSIQAAGAGN